MARQPDERLASARFRQNRARGFREETVRLEPLHLIKQTNQPCRVCFKGLRRLIRAELIRNSRIAARPPRNSNLNPFRRLHFCIFAVRAVRAVVARLVISSPLEIALF